MAAKEQIPSIVPAGDALKMAQKWLAQKGLRPTLAEQTAEEAELDKPRPAGLGLGAKFLPHHKGKTLAANADTQLRRRLAPSRQSEHQTNAAGAQPDSSSDDEDTGRANAFVAKRKLVVQADSNAFPLAQPAKKKKKKNKGVSGASTG